MHAVTRGLEKAKSNWWFTNSFNATARGHQKKVFGVSITPNRRWFLTQFVVKTTDLPAKQCHGHQNPAGAEKEGKQAQGIQIHNICRNYSLLMKLQAEHVPAICWHPWPHACSRAKLDLGSKLVQPATLTCSPGFGMAPDRAVLRLGTVQPAPLLSPHRNTHHTFIPGIPQKAPGHRRFPVPLPDLRDALSGAASREAVRLQRAKLKGHRYHRSCATRSKASVTKVQCLMRGSIQKWSKRVACLEKRMGRVVKKWMP